MYRTQVTECFRLKMNSDMVIPIVPNPNDKDNEVYPFSFWHDKDSLLEKKVEYFSIQGKKEEPVDTNQKQM